MPLIRARCHACAQPLGDAPHVAIPLSCRSCGLALSIVLAADGQPVDFDAAFAPMRLLHWFASARAAMARGAVGVAIGKCSRCDAALVVSSRDHVSLPCPHCRTPIEGPAASILADQWPEPWARASGGGIALEYRVAVVDDAGGMTAGCAACGLPTDAKDPTMTCRRCNAVVWVERPGPAEQQATRRIQLGVRIDGTRDDRPFNALVSLAQGEQMLRSDAALGASAASGSSLLGVTGIGCAVAIALIVLLGVMVAILVHFAK